jgi:hypothetical protein
MLAQAAYYRIAGSSYAEMIPRMADLQTHADKNIRYYYCTMLSDRPQPPYVPMLLLCKAAFLNELLTYVLLPI